MSRAAMIPLFALLSACGGTKIHSLDEAFVPPHDVSWHETVLIDGLVRLSFTVTQQWAGPHATDDGKQAWTVVETEQRPEGLSERARYEVVSGPDGFGYKSSTAKDGSVVAWDPPELVLPADPKVGATWKATHKKGDDQIERSCEIMKSDLCGGGLVSVCDSTHSNGQRVVMREHFCPGLGWAGYESLQIKDGHNEKRWSEQLVRDGISGP